MKSSLTILGCLLAFTGMTQGIEAVVDSSDLTLVDATEVERIILDGETQCIEIAVNDTLLLKINGGSTPVSMTLININTLVQTGLEIGADGLFSFGEFAPPPAVHDPP